MTGNGEGGACPTRFVAEVSSNHGRDLDRAFAFIDRTAEVGCHAVKFQQFRVDELFCPEALARDPRLAARREWELPEEHNAPLAERARAAGLAFASTPFYLGAVDVLAPHVDFFKVSSYQVLWHGAARARCRDGEAGRAIDGDGRTWARSRPPSTCSGMRGAGT